MKKLAIYFFAGILLVSASCNSDGSKSGTDSSAASTINNDTDTASQAKTDDLKGKGVTEAEAKDMIKAFDKSPQYYSERTSAWFNENVIESLHTVLHDSAYKLDGVRIYLALNGKKKHVFLIVPTYENGSYRLKQCSGIDSTFTIHQDFFKASIASKYPVYQGKYEGPHETQVQTTSGCPIGAKPTYVYIGGKKHKIPCDTALDWVSNRLKPNELQEREQITTYSEWFETSFIDSLRSVLQNKTAKGRDGVRVYIGRTHQVDCENRREHVFIITTTLKLDNKNNEDSFDLFPTDPTADDNGEQCLNNCEGVSMLGPNALRVAKKRISRVVQKNTRK